MPAKNDQDLHLRVPKADLEEWKRVAETERMTLSDWIRRTCYAAVRQHDTAAKPKKARR